MATETLQSVEDLKLPTTFHNNLTIHSRSGTHEQLWARVKMIGAGAFGDVWLEQKVRADHTPELLGEAGAEAEVEVERVPDVDLRAVKRIRYTGQNLDWSRELKILAQLKNNPSFVDFRGWYDDRSNYVYFAMEYMRHGDLSQYLKKAGPSARPQAKAIVSQVLKGLIALHDQNICHRDIKSKNILVAYTNPITVKIANFGLSKHDHNATSLRTACGTSHYIAPELQGFIRPSRNRRTYTNLVDIWSLGILTHEILTTQLPFLQCASPDSDSDSDSEDEDPESGIEMDSRFENQEETVEYPEMDMALFANYCSGKSSFPRGPLETAGISSAGIAFVEAVLVANPRSRISAEKALGHEWLHDPRLEPYGVARDETAVAEVSDSEGSDVVREEEEGEERDGREMEVVLHRGSEMFRKRYAARERFNKFGVNRTGVMQQRYARERRFVDM
ncbi:uncharacterized protein LAJ45_05859 [Morchella importuna]|uniref:uncharacterized protein n=1 Tax=Morchella importuna TaxID=1174673 RepID=UPI001E8E73AA|nr:uncharacterized protein LAJ45_05859 [Morchella importuna]KAH8150173.1 hypothetical protein LAJ45_05859 [Morchella importuna]